MTIDDLKSEISKRGGIANTNKFLIHIEVPDYVQRRAFWNSTESTKSLNILSESVNFPGKQIESLDYSMYRNQYKMPTGYINDELNVTFRLTNDFFVKRVFDEWQSGIIDKKTYKARYNDEYARPMDIAYNTKSADKGLQLNNFAIKVTDCYPITVGAIEMSNEDSDTVAKLQVTFAYRDIEFTSASEVRDNLRIMSEEELSSLSEARRQFELAEMQAFRGTPRVPRR